MLGMFIAVFLVLAVMTLFLFLVVSKCISRLNESVKGDFLKHLNVYDHQIEEKSRKVQELSEQIHRMETDSDSDDGKRYRESHGEAVVIDTTAAYVDRTFGENYVYMNDVFRPIAREAMEETIHGLVRARKDINVHEFREILNLFTYDLQYEMLMLDSEEQLSVMETVAQNSVGKKRILKRYVESHGGFDFKEFMDYVRDYIFRNDATIYVYSRDGRQVIEGTPKHVVYEKDTAIVEGYKIKHKNRIYDYSL